jgi:hypothetical protein
MKVRVQYTVGGPQTRYRLTSIEEVGSPTYCCTAMADEWGGVVDVAVSGFPRVRNIKPVICVSNLFGARGIVSATVPIAHCPWCGSSIEIVDEGLSRPDGEDDNTF